MKRFTETTKWENVWFSELTTPQKLLWMFMLDKSDASGVWEPNWKLASFMIGADLKEADLEAFGDRIQMLESGKVLIVPFVQFQYGKLSPQCRPHLKVFESMQKHGLECEDGIVFPSRSRPSNLTERKRLSVFERDGNICVYCGKSGELEVDHIVPRQRGGKDAFSNLASACHDCNARKGTHDVDEFIETLEDPKSAKQRLSEIAKYPSLVGYLDRVQDKEKEKEEETEGGTGGNSDLFKTTQTAMERKSSRARPETIEQVIEFCRAQGLPENDGRYFWEKWNGSGFTNGGKPMKDWQAVIRSWKLAGHCPSQKLNGQHKPGTGPIGGLYGRVRDVTGGVG